VLAGAGLENTEPMSESIFWVHGTSLVTETYEHVFEDGRYGWGADVSVLPGKDSWFHLPIPIAVPAESAGVDIREVYVRFHAEAGSLRSVHIYDGSTKVHEFNDLHREGEFRTDITSQNTFSLPRPHTLRSGLGISLWFIASSGFDTEIPPSRFIVASAGAQAQVIDERRLADAVQCRGMVNGG
jgi:hypothetical protein